MKHRVRIHFNDGSKSNHVEFPMASLDAAVKMFKQVNVQLRAEVLDPQGQVIMVKDPVVLKHKVKCQDWINGELETLEITFDFLEEAMEFARASVSQLVKVYDQNNQLVHSRQNSPVAVDATYA